ncbi:hypothetical protein [Hydrogenivirga sp. 128-5-R1-1]|uniref:hypothetical protein n=1 Tax=Hydrogenivirga sp. 128-5-R1-1 TaxID=392423 RepID=UPI00015F0C74|nr:hypothetical protein [Hydrogenivirga sp. 128-5-R1-1]EDP75989.1 hypothetical protein HG1285_06670 [Hydrogenivirga sp. 128-5-R1-1]
MISEVLEKIKELPFVEDVETLTELPEDVEADLGIRVKLTKDAGKYPVSRIISKVLNEISWKEFESSGRYPAIYWE